MPLDVDRRASLPGSICTGGLRSGGGYPCLMPSDPATSAALSLEANLDLHLSALAERVLDALDEIRASRGSVPPDALLRVRSLGLSLLMVDVSPTHSLVDLDRRLATRLDEVAFASGRECPPMNGDDQARWTYRVALEQEIFDIANSDAEFDDKLTSAAEWLIEMVREYSAPFVETDIGPAFNRAVTLLCVNADAPGSYLDLQRRTTAALHIRLDAVANAQVAMHALLARQPRKKRFGIF